MRVTEYRDAVMELAAGGLPGDQVLSGLMRVLKERHHERLYPRILRELHTVLLRSEAARVARVTFAREADAARLREDVQSALVRLGITDHRVRIDKTLTGGFIAETNTERIDQSYKTTLLTLYRSLIARI